VRRLTLALFFLASAAAATAVFHARTLGYGFDYDDYHFIRPYSRAEVLAAFQGPWDASGIELPYYRPLTITFFAARFELLGVDSAAHHALSLVLFAAAGFLTAWLVYGLTGRPAGSLLAMLFLVVHPAVPYSLVAWVTNQMHLLETLLVLLAFCWWNAVRRRSLGWWTPLLLLAGAAFLVKEDGIMLLPGVVALHEVRRRVAERNLPRVPAAFVVMAIVAIGALLLLRGGALSGPTSRQVPAVAAAFNNYLAGLDRVFRLAPADRPWQGAASYFVMALPIAALLLWRRTTPGSRALLVSGLCIALLFNLPFVFVTKAEQLHLVTVGAVITLAASVLAILDACRARAARVSIVGGVALGTAALAVVTVGITRDFEPFDPIVLSHDDIVRGWAAVPAEIRSYLAEKRQPDARDRLSSNPAVALERITFGVHAKERGADGVVFQWMSGTRTEILLASRIHSIGIPLRHAIELFKEPAHVTIQSDGRTVDQIELNTPQWRVSQVNVGLMRPSWRGGMHRVAIRVNRAWKPSEVIPGSADGRLLGLQLGEITMRPALPSR
jgi:hypothetical protein